MNAKSFSVLTTIFGLATSALIAPQGHSATQPPEPPPKPATGSGGDLFELSAGYAYLKLGSGADLDHLNGVDASVFVNVTRWLGCGTEFTAAFGSDDPRIRNVGPFNARLHMSDNRYVYLFGPRANFWLGNRVRVYGQLLAGGFHVDAEETSRFGFAKTSGDALAYSIGAGTDWRFTPHLYWRLLQTDYLHMNFKHQEDNWRFTTGLVFAFGGKK
jgi:hypothetical protein